VPLTELYLDILLYKLLYSYYKSSSLITNINSFIKLCISLNIYLALDKIGKYIIGTVLLVFIIVIIVNSGIWSWFIKNIILV